MKDHILTPEEVSKLYSHETGMSARSEEEHLGDWYAKTSDALSGEIKDDEKLEDPKDLHQYTNEELDMEFNKILNKDVGYDGPPNARSTMSMYWSTRDEVWREVPEVHPDYQLFISSHGRFRTKLKEEVNSEGRKFISIAGTMYPLDVLVASLFNKNSSMSEDVIHINGKNDDDNADNLLWVPHKRSHNPVISSIHIRRREYPHNTLRASMYSHIHQYIDGVITPYIMAMLGYLTPMQQKKLWEQANKTMSRPVLRALREHYPWLDRINTDNISTWGLDSITPTGKHVVSMGDNPYNMTYYELDDESYEEAIRIKKERIERNVKIDGLERYKSGLENPDEPRDEENLFGTEEKERQIIDVDEYGVPVDPYGVISRGIMEMRVENRDASIMRVKVGKSVQKNDHCVDNGSLRSDHCMSNSSENNDYCEDVRSYVSANAESNVSDKQGMPDNNAQNTQTQKKKVIQNNVGSAGAIFGSQYGTGYNAGEPVVFVTKKKQSAAGGNDNAANDEQSKHSSPDIHNYTDNMGNNSISALYPEIDSRGALYRDMDDMTESDMDMLVEKTRVNDEKKKPRIWNFMKRKDKTAFEKKEDEQITELKEMGYDVPDKVPERNTIYKGSINSAEDYREAHMEKGKIGAGISGVDYEEKMKEKELDIFQGKGLSPEEYERRKTEFQRDGILNGNKMDSNAGMNDLAFEPLVSQERRLTNYQKGIVGLIRHRERVEEINQKIPGAEKLSPGEVKDIEGKIRHIKEIPHPELLAVSYKTGQRGRVLHPVVATLPNGREIVYANLSAAARQLNLNVSSISRVCKGLQRQTGGIRFRFVEMRDKLGVIDEYIADMEAGLIEHFTLEMGQEIKKRDMTNRRGRPRKEDRKGLNRAGMKKGKKVKKMTYDEDGNVLRRRPGRPRKVVDSSVG